MAAKGLDITVHRQRMITQDLEAKFKNPTDPLQIVFVCAMWTTGFDVPSCSTIYLDKPMKNHTLMQAIARANRVFPEKANGLIVDYIGVFRDLEKAFSIVELLIVNDDTKLAFQPHVRLVDRLFKTILPDVAAGEFGPVRALLGYLAGKIAALNPVVDVSEVMTDIEALLDRSVAANAYVVHAQCEQPPTPIDLNAIDWQALAAKFATGRKHTEVEKLKAALTLKAARMARLNPTRADLVERLVQLIAQYNAGSLNVEQFFADLIEFANTLNEEERRGLAENLDQEQLAIYDLITRPAPELTDVDTQLIKAIAEHLLAKLKAEKLVLDWRKQQQSRAAVRVAVETELDQLPRK